MRHSMAFSLAFLALVLAVPAPALAAEILTNGNVDNGPSMGGNVVMALPVGSTALPGWTVTRGAVTWVSDGYWEPLSGTKSLELSNNGAGGIKQAFASAPGATYRLSFWMSGEPFSLPKLKHLRVLTAGQPHDYTFDNTPAWHWDMAWQQHVVDFGATASTTTIELYSLTSGDWGPAIDSVRVTLVSADAPFPADEFTLAPVAPDPVRSSARFSFALPRALHVSLTVQDVLGREVARIADGELAAGRHDLAWTPHSRGARPGLYFAVLRSDAGTRVRRFTVLH